MKIACVLSVFVLSVTLLATEAVRADTICVKKYQKVDKKGQVDISAGVKKFPGACPKGYTLLLDTAVVTAAGKTGPQGERGDTGPAGPVGDKGERGDTGPAGPIGPKGDRGETGATGPMGSIGPVGPKGEKGEPGAPGISAGGTIRGQLYEFMPGCFRKSEPILWGEVHIAGTPFSSHIDEEGNFELSYIPTGSYELSFDYRPIGNKTVVAVIEGETTDVGILYLNFECCGDGKLQEGEICDPDVSSEKSCDKLGFLSGEAYCNTTCDGYDTKWCSNTCGNGIIDEGEACDTGDFAGTTCEDLGHPGGGKLYCNDSCSRIEDWDCYEEKCGNGTVDAGEECDTYSSAACSSLGLGSGYAYCEGCKWDKEECSPANCGNGLIDSGEECDGFNFGGKTCATQGFLSGSLSCNSRCELSTINCSNTCGNGIIDSGEVCDGSNFGGQTCQTQGYTSGSLYCAAGCKQVYPYCS